MGCSDNSHVGVAVGGLVDLGLVDDEEDLFEAVLVLRSLAKYSRAWQALYVYRGLRMPQEGPLDHLVSERYPQ